ncbi:c-type cytochrome [Thalassobellus suaedae]|uniref:Cytochrome c n=1 Tax=Thalassobellus suaedae TaxID=3074124 RepID=A0ABY9Y020_9FLAO|nr:cytochrome c [Flavobacteriaceae bacterium HL-DH10]
MKIFFLSLLATVSLSCNSQNNALKASVDRGSEIYTDFCISCHLPNGTGVKKIYPPLANSDYLLKNREASIKAIKFGLNGEIIVNNEKYNNVMAALGLSNDEVADVMNYISNSWGNKNDKIVTEEEVSKIKK